MNDNRPKYLLRSKDNVSVYFCIFILFLTSMELWIAWNGRGNYINFFVGSCLFLLIKKKRIKLNLRQRNVAIFFSLFLAFAYLKMVYLSAGGIAGYLLGYIFPASLIIFLNDNERVKCLRYIVKWFALLMVPAIITYILCQTVGLPSLGTLKLHDSPYQADWYLYKENYFFCTMYAQRETERFNGPFNEPGHLGMMSAFLLFADGFKFNKKSTWIIFLALLMTFSLSGYILAFVGYLFSKYEKGKIKLKWLVPLLLFVVGGYLYANNYNEGDNDINERIVERLEPDEEMGIAGNNRSTGDIHFYFLDMLSDPYLIMFGYDREAVEEWAYEGSRGTGMEMYMVSHGLIGVFLSMLFYFVAFLYRKNNKEAIFFLVFIILVLLQRSYWYWFSWIICYLYGIATWTKSRNKESVD